jgi:hypothetical protein
VAFADSNPFNHASVTVLGGMPPVGVKLESEPLERRKGTEEEERRRGVEVERKRGGEGTGG